MRIAYADPPYPGCSHLYEEQQEVDHLALARRLERDFDGYIYHTSSTALSYVLPMFAPPARVMAWVKPFAAFKRNVSVAYAWEPVIVCAERKGDDWFDGGWWGRYGDNSAMVVAYNNNKFGEELKSGFIFVTWYKMRGACGTAMTWEDRDDPVLLTLDVAELALEEEKA